MSSELCNTCRAIFSGPRRLRESLPHHANFHDLSAAASSGCRICQHVHETAGMSAGFALEAYLTPVVGLPQGWLKLSIEQVAESIDDEDDDGSSSNGLDDSGDEGPGAEAGDPLWGFMLLPSASTAEAIGDWHPPERLDSARLFALAQDWYQHCSSTHTQCNVGTTSTFSPTRLLDLNGTPTPDSIRLIRGDSLLNKERYATVSHVWGKAKTLKLLTSNLSDLEKSIEISELPVSYKEAIMVAKRFGIRYIWIDSLCIIQDSTEDWLREASMMGDVYGQSCLNIALAGAAESSQASFASRKEAWIRPVPLEARWGGLPSTGYYVMPEEFQADVKQSKLRSRAWIHQELFLAPKVLLLGQEQMWYECWEGQASETFPSWAPKEWYGATQSYAGLRDRGDQLRHLSWENNTEAYSCCDLTFHTDRLIAIAGVANYFQRRLQDDYVAGLWRSQLPSELLWTSVRHHKTFRPEIWRAPSWSWCSIEGGVQFESRPALLTEGTLRVLCSVEDINVQLQDRDDPTGPLLGGSISLRGPLHPVLPWHDEETGNGVIAVYDPVSQKARVIETSDAVRDQFGARHVLWEGDECDDDGGFAFEYQHEDMSLMETGAIQYPDKVGAWCLTIQAWEQEGSPSCNGLVIQSVEAEPGTYKRIGKFWTFGEEVARFSAAEMRSIRIV